MAQLQCTVADVTPVVVQMFPAVSTVPVKPRRVSRDADVGGMGRAGALEQTGPAHRVRFKDGKLFRFRTFRIQHLIIVRSLTRPYPNRTGNGIAHSHISTGV